MLDSYRRLPQWRSRLSKSLTASASRPFSWGTHDCCVGLAFPAINAVIGIDLSGPYTGEYTTAMGALLTLKRNGHGGILELFQSNFVDCHPAFARHGDVVAKTDPDGNWGMGVVLGSRVAVLLEEGFGTIDLANCERAFRVG